MCFAIIEITRKAISEPKELVKIDSQEALDDRIKLIHDNDQIASYKIFTPGPRHTRQVSWVEEP